MIPELLANGFLFALVGLFAYRYFGDLVALAERVVEWEMRVWTELPHGKPSGKARVAETSDVDPRTERGQARQKYIEGEIDEGELEKRLEQALQ